MNKARRGFSAGFVVVFVADLTVVDPTELDEPGYSSELARDSLVSQEVFRDVAAQAA